MRCMPHFCSLLKAYTLDSLAHLSVLNLVYLRIQSIFGPGKLVPSA